MVATNAAAQSMVRTVLDSDLGQIAASVVLGFGLAALFRKACKDNLCVVVKGPPLQDTEKYFYKVEDDCYKYTPVVTECDAAAIPEAPAPRRG